MKASTKPQARPGRKPPTLAPRTSRSPASDDLDARVMALYRPWVAIEANEGELQEDEDTLSATLAAARAQLEAERRRFAAAVRTVEAFIERAQSPFDARGRRRALSLYREMEKKVAVDGAPIISTKLDGFLGMLSWMVLAVEDQGVHPRRAVVLAEAERRRNPPAPAAVAAGREDASRRARRRP